MATIAKGKTFGETEEVTAAKLHQLVDSATLSSLVNADIDDGAAIVDTKLSTISTAGKIDGGALTGLANIPSGAGQIPAANLTTNTTSILNSIYPVGIVVTLGVSTNPGTLFGVGTWTAIAGKVIVGIDATQTEFDVLDETGGAKTVNASHTHSVAVPAAGWGNTTGVLGTMQTFGGPSGSDGSVGQTLTSGSGGSATESNLPPYIVKYVWQRTA